MEVSVLVVGFFLLLFDDVLFFNPFKLGGTYLNEVRFPVLFYLTTIVQRFFSSVLVYYL